MDRFTLNLTLGNSAMSGYEDIARALRAVAEQVESFTDSGRIRDENGNTVGRFEIIGA